MIVRLKEGDLLRLRRSAGATIDVFAGRVWISEEGSLIDRVLDQGKRYRLQSPGLVLVGAEQVADGGHAELAVQQLDVEVRVGGGRRLRKWRGHAKSVASASSI